jgi:hypothetical protein
VTVSPLLAFGRPAREVIQYAYTVPDIDAAIDVYVSRLNVGPWFRRGPFTPPAARYRGGRRASSPSRSPARSPATR